MDVFDLFAKLSLDTSSYDNKLSAAKKSGTSFSKGLATAAKVGVAAVGAATTAITGLVATSVKAGAEFDKSMSQVYATMGDKAKEAIVYNDRTMTSMEALREYAQEMGRTTAFSASEAADALNYMALAGYDAQKSMDMLPNVLNLAAAGTMDLATASDMVTDTQTAFGISLQRTSLMVDEMAKAASTGNTSVEQLGDAFLTVGGLAQELNGGLVKLSDGSTQSVDGIQELEIALTAMANAGIKGSEAGTHMRNMLLKLSSPTDAGTQALEKMGVAVFNDAGQMRSLADVFGDLTTQMDKMTQEEKIQTISDLFNTRDLASAEALLNAVGQDWDKIGESILDAHGAAEEMAKTQLDNLAGDVTLFKSALEGAQIAISDMTSGPLREFVQLGTKMLSWVTAAYKNNGLEGAMKVFGRYLTQGIDIVVKKIPEFVNAGMELLGAVGKGILDNLPTIIDAAVQIVVQLAQGLVKALPELGKGVITLINSLIKSFRENSGTLMQVGIDLIKTLWEGLTEGLPQLASMAVELMTNFAQYLRENLPQMISVALNALMEFSASLRENAGLLISAALDLILALAQGLIDALPAIIETVPTIIDNIVNIINDTAPKLIVAGVKLIVMLVKGLIQAIPTIIKEMPKIIKAIWDTFTAINWATLGANVVTNIANGLKALGPNLPKILQAFGNKAMNVVKNIDWLGLGKNIITFIVKGLKAFVRMIPEALKAIASNAVTAVKSINWIDLGKNIINGIISGITALGSSAVKAVVDVGKEMFNGIADFFRIESPSKEMRDKIGKNIVLGMIAGVDAEKKNAKKSAEELSALYVTAAKSKLDALKANNKLSLMEEWAYWLEVQKSVKEGTTAYEETVEQIGKVKKELNKSLSDLDKDYKKNITDIITTLDEKITALQKTYVEAVAKRKDEIVGMFSLFDAPQINEAIGGKTLIENMRTQVDSLTEWSKTLSILKGRLGETDLYKELEEMGVSSLNTLKELTKMSDEELAEYNMLYERRNLIAQARAEQEHEQLLADTEKSIDDLKKQANEQLDKLEEEYTKAVAALGVTERKNFKKAGKKAIKGLGEGMMTEFNSVENELLSRAEQLAAKLEDAFERINDSMKKIKSSSASTSSYDYVGTSTSSSSSSGVVGRVLSNTATLVQNLTINSPKSLSASEVARQTRLANQQMVLSLRGV